MMTINICRTAALVIFLLPGACDAAFVVDIVPSKPRLLLTRIRNLNTDGINTTEPNGWDKKQPHSRLHTFRKKSPPEMVVPEVNPRETQLELQIQELQAKLGRMPAKQDNNEIFLTLLDVRDNLTRALEAVPAEEKEANDALKALCEGVQMTEQRLDQAFEMSGIVRYGAVGDPFDHNIHHALCEFPDPEKDADTVGHIIKTGYFLNERVLRCAEVAVVKSEPSPDETCDVAYE